MAGGVLTPAVGQYLCSLTYLYREPMPLHGFQVVARALSECAARAWWLLDPAITVRIRMSRVYTQRWKNVDAIGKVASLVGDDTTASTDAIVALRAQGALLGLDEQFEKKKDGTPGRFLGYQGGQDPGSTGLVEQYFAALHSPHGEVWYRTMSAICHGTAYGLLESYSHSPADSPNLVTLTPTLKPEALAHVAIMSVEMFLGVVEAYAESFGWASAEIAQKKEFCRTVLMSITADRLSGRG